MTPEEARAELSRRGYTFNSDGTVSRPKPSEDNSSSILPKIMKGANYVLNPLNAATDLGVEISKNPRKFYDSTQSFIPAVAGTAATLAAGPEAAIPGAAAGEFARQAINTAIGNEDVPKTAAGRAGSVALQGLMGAPEKIIGAIPGVAKAGSAALNVGKEVGKSALESAATILETLTGLPKQRILQQFSDPLVPLPIIASMLRKRAGARYGEVAEREFGPIQRSAKEIFDPELTEARKAAVRADQKILEQNPRIEGKQIYPGKFRFDTQGKVPLVVENNPLTPQDLLRGEQGANLTISKAMRGAGSKQVPGMLDELDKMQQLIGEFSPQLAEEIKNYHDAIRREVMSNILPTNLSTGKTSLMKNIVAPAAAAAGFAGTSTVAPQLASVVPMVIEALFSPAGVSSAVGAAGLTAKAAKNLMKVPMIRNAVGSVLAQKGVKLAEDATQ